MKQPLQQRIAFWGSPHGEFVHCWRPLAIEIKPTEMCFD